MAIVVEHDKRRAEILKKSLEVFVEEGYDDVTFQKIADRCGITRTTLYIYFKNKREIFLWSIKQLTGGIEAKIREAISDKTLTSQEALRKVLDLIVSGCENNRELFSVLLSYLLNLSKTGGDPSERVRRRLVRLQHLLSTIIIKGIKNNEFKQVNVKAANEMLYGLIQSAIFRLSVLGEKDIRDVRDSLNLAVDGLIAV